MTDEEESSERLRDPVHVTLITCCVFANGCRLWLVEPTWYILTKIDPVTIFVWPECMLMSKVGGNWM